jgi:hypothetical protein
MTDSGDPGDSGPTSGPDPWAAPASPTGPTNPSGPTDPTDPTVPLGAPTPAGPDDVPRVPDAPSPVGGARTGWRPPRPPWRAKASDPSLLRERPGPHLRSIVGVGAGLLVVAAMVSFLAELGANRVGGVLLSLLFEAVGVGLLLLRRDQRSATAGVALTAIGIVPLLVYLFVDVKNPDETFGSIGDFTTTATLILLAAAALWMAAYLFGPGRRYAFYLGAALVALWLVAVVQIVDDPLDQAAEAFASSFSPFSSDFDSGTGFDSDSGSFDPSTDFDPITGLDSGSGSFDPSTGFDVDSGTFTDEGGGSFQQAPEPLLPEAFGPSEEDLPDGNALLKKLGWVTVAFGAAYLGLAQQSEARRDRRQATPLLAVGLPLVVLGIGILSSGAIINIWIGSLLTLAVGAAGIALGTRAERRFTSWFGIFLAFDAISAMVLQAVGESPRGSGVVFLVLGLVAAVAVGVLPGGPDPLPAGAGDGPEPDLSATGADDPAGAPGGPGDPDLPTGPPTGDPTLGRYPSAPTVASSWPSAPPTGPATMPTSPPVAPSGPAIWERPAEEPEGPPG